MWNGNKGCAAHEGNGMCLESAGLSLAETEFVFNADEILDIRLLLPSLLSVDPDIESTCYESQRGLSIFFFCVSEY